MTTLPKMILPLAPTHRDIPTPISESVTGVGAVGSDIGRIWLDSGGMA